MIAVSTSVWEDFSMADAEVESVPRFTKLAVLSSWVGLGVSPCIVESLGDMGSVDRGMLEENGQQVFENSEDLIA